MAVIPQDASFDVRRSIEQINDELDQIKKENARLLQQISVVQGDAEKENRDLKKEIRTPSFLNFNDVFRGSGGAHAIGHVPDPGETARPEGFERYLRGDGNWRAGIAPFLMPGERHQIINLPGHTHVAGALMASKITAGNGLDFIGDLRPPSEASVVYGTELIKRQFHASRPTSCSHFDDFVCSSAANPGAGTSYGWGDGGTASFSTNGNGILIQYAGDIASPGAVYYTPGSVVDGEYGTLHANRIVDPLRLDMLQGWGWNGRPQTVSAMEYRVGPNSSVSSKGSDGIWFEKLTGDTNWFAVTGNGSSYTRTDTGVTLANNIYHDLECDCSDATSIKFYIDNALVATHTTNIPGITTFMNMCAMVIFRTGGSNSFLLTDYWYWNTATPRNY